MTLVLACAAIAMAWVLASGVAALTIGRMMHRADAEESGRIRRVSQIR
jgi:hypothetical protein